MKRSTIFTLLIASLAIVVLSTGCKKKPTSITPIPGQSKAVGSGGPGDAEMGTRLDSGPDISAIDTQGVPASTSQMNTGEQKRDILQTETIYFALDSATISADSKPKLARVADYLKANADHDVLIEGHCDERGTEGYNLSLGEKRAMAAREYLVSLGAPADNIFTVSHGETRPAAEGQNEGAYSKNRRCEFVVALPAQ